MSPPATVGGWQKTEWIRFVAVPPKLDLKSVSDMEKKGKSLFDSMEILPRTPRYENGHPIKNPCTHDQNYSDPKHNLHPIEVPMDAIEVRVYFINVCVYFVKGHFYLTKTGVYSAFFYLINF